MRPTATPRPHRAPRWAQAGTPRARQRQRDLRTQKTPRTVAEPTNLKFNLIATRRTTVLLFHGNPQTQHTLHAGADTNIQASNGNTAHHYLIRMPRATEFAVLLAEGGADLNALNRGNTPLMYSRKTEEAHLRRSDGRA
jgi:hypothetical protein